jgi:hypothetical protein
MRRTRVFLCSMMFLASSGYLINLARAEDKPSVDPEALKRAQYEVKKLDHLYKTAAIGITKTYVAQQFDTPAATVAKVLFEEMKKGGFHNARILDVTGKPKDKENVAKTEFEKAAVKAIKDGKPYVEEIGEVDGKPVLRAATVLPAVLKSCASCHGVKEGDMLGTLVYEVPIR